MGRHRRLSRREAGDDGPDLLQQPKLRESPALPHQAARAARRAARFRARVCQLVIACGCRAAGDGGYEPARRFVLINMETADGPGVPLWRIASRGSDEAAGAEAIPQGGRIEGPAQARGRVDSLAGAPLPLAPGASGMVTITIATGETLDEVRGRDEAFRRLGIAGSLARTRAH